MTSPAKALADWLICPVLSVPPCNDWPIWPTSWFAVLSHYCPVDRERTVSKHLMQNGFLAIWRGVDLKLAAVSQTLFRGGAAHVLRKDGIRAADGLLALEYIFAARDALWWRLRRANVSVCRAVSGHGVRPTDLPGKPARH